MVACVTTETRHLGRLGQLGEFEQNSNTDSKQKSNTNSHSARNKAHVARQSAADAAKRHRTAKSRATRKRANPPATKLEHSPDKTAGLHTSQSLPNLTRGSSTRATPLAPRVAQHEASHRGLHPAVVLVEDSAQLLQHAVDELSLGERAQAGLAGCAAELKLC